MSQPYWLPFRGPRCCLVAPSELPAPPRSSSSTSQLPHLSTFKRSPPTWVTCYTHKTARCPGPHERVISLSEPARSHVTHAAHTRTHTARYPHAARCTLARRTHCECTPAPKEAISTQPQHSQQSTPAASQQRQQRQQRQHHTASGPRDETKNPNCIQIAHFHTAKRSPLPQQMSSATSSSQRSAISSKPAAAAPHDIQGN